MRQLLAILLVAVLGWSLASCSQPNGPGIAALTKPARGRLTEVSPPFTIQNLKQGLEGYQPQVKILSPRVNQVLEDTDVEVRLQVNDLPLFKDEVLELGPYLQVVLDSQPYAQLHDIREPLTLENLAPGTHTLRVFAARPWHESFKNEGAFAQTTFHIFTQTPENSPNPGQPLLTYNYPQGTYGAEPVLLDFVLTNAPLHLVAREDSQDAIPDWQVRCTINGESFVFDRWEPIYLKGLKPGKNWVQLELLDEQGNPLTNAFNNAVQVVTYEPNGTDTLAQLTRGELTAEAARKIVDPNYVPPEPEVAPPEVILEPDLTHEPVPETMPPEVVAPPAEIPEVEEQPAALPEVEEQPAALPEVEEPPAALPEVEEPKVEEPKEPEIEASKVEAPRVKELEPEPELLPSRLPQPSPADAQSAETTPTIPSSAPVTQPAAAEPKGSAQNSETTEAIIRSVMGPGQSESLPTELEMPAETASTRSAEDMPSVEPSIEQPEPASAPQPVPSLPVQPLPSPQPAPTSQSPQIPNMVTMLDRVKDFFEGLRKRPVENETPILAPLLPDQKLPEPETVPQIGSPSEPD